jgi:hypothetical protein
MDGRARLGGWTVAGVHVDRTIGGTKDRNRSPDFLGWSPASPIPEPGGRVLRYVERQFEQTDCMVSKCRAPQRLTAAHHGIQGMPM